MGISKGILLGSATALLAVAGAQAADLPGRKSAPVEYVKVCDAYGAGFFYIPGTDTCLKVGGYVRVDYDYRPARKETGYAHDGGTSSNIGVLYTKNANDLTTSGFYNRGVVSLDARTQSAWGTVQTVMALRLETAGGMQQKASTGASLEAAYVRFAGFTFGQAAQPFAFMSSWAYNTHYWTGWPNGVRQLAYTHTFGGGFSATVAMTDAKAYNAVSQGLSAATGSLATITTAGKDESFSQPGRAGIVWVGNLRYDQSWGSAQIMGAYQRGGENAGASNTTIYNSPIAGTGTDFFGSNETGYAIGAGLAVNLPMIAAGDRIELTAVYADRLANLLADGGINSPSAAAYGLNPLGGPSINFANGTGYSFGMNLRHYWAPTIRSQVYASYTSRKLHDTSDGVYTASYTGAKGSAYSLGHALIWSPVSNFDIGLELTYLRAEWNAAAVASSYKAGGTGATAYPAYAGSLSESNFIGKVRVQRNF